MNKKIEITTATSVLLSNGFQRGQWVRFLEKMEGEWKEVRLCGTGECTHVSDEKVTDMEVHLAGHCGIVGGFWGAAGITVPFYQKYLKQFFGFTPEELAGPAPETGYTCKDYDFNAYGWERVETLADYLEAKFVWDNFTPWSSMEDGVYGMPYCFGDQSAASFILLKGGQVVDSVSGSGDTTPYLTKSKAECLANGRISSSNAMLDEQEKWAEEDRKFEFIAKKLGVWKRYIALSSDHSSSGRSALSDLVRKVNEAMIRLEADERASRDSTGILGRLLTHYRKSQNPLRSLRQDKGGKWKFHRECPTVATGTEVFHGDDWWVSWSK